MAFSWNDEQKKAIGLRDASLLVSAAAGSGKTTVMVERILTMLTDKENPIDIDRLLVVTFTRAAASSMREKILNAIRERCDKEPDNEHLRRQLTLVGHTQITTIDSFCLHIVRNHFHAAGIEPGFRIGEEGELALLKQDVSEAVMEQFYQEKDPVFLALTESYGSAKSDDAVREMMLALYERAQSGPDPSGWLDNCLSCYPDPSDETISEWLSEYLDAVYFPEIRELAAEWEAYADLLKAPDAPGHYRSAILQDLAFLENLSSASDYDTIREILIGFQPEKLKGSSKFDGDKALQQRIKDRRDLLKKRVESFRKDTFCDPLEIQLKRLGETKPAARELIRLSECFLRSFAKEKEKRKLVDFNDIEHFALRILRDEKGKPTQTALEYRSHFYEVMIDEYQDSNYLQEAILTAVAPIVNGVPRLFMVGDVKQSIYRFRQARPELFMGKYASFSYEDSPQRKIDLFYNYRSRHEVIDTVNRIFSGLMRTDHCGIEYDEAARLHQGADESEDPQADYATEVWLLASDSGREDLLKETAQLIAAEIERLVNGEAIQGLRYKDIAILLRSFSDAPAIFQRAFRQKGIPLIVQSKTGYFQTYEIHIMTAFLQVLDNPMQDIPLAALMHSEIGSFSAEDLAKIRAAFPQMSFHRAVLSLKDNRPDEMEEELYVRIRAFLAMLADYRKLVPDLPVYELISRILDETGFSALMSAAPDGEKRSANLSMLIARARSYENSSYHGLHNFNRYISNLKKYSMDYGEAEVLGEEEDAVTLMTIHKSKGLEFPVVFVPEIHKTFHLSDASRTMVVHPDYGFGLKYLNRKEHRKADTLLRRVLAEELTQESIAEEMRVLYVALTRAKKKLYLIGKEQKVSAVSRDAAGRLSVSDLATSRNYLRWILPAFDCQSSVIRRIDPAEVIAEEESYDTMKRNERIQKLLSLLDNCDAAHLSEIRSVLEWEDPYADQALLPKKVSVSDLKREAYEARIQQLSDDPQIPPAAPDGDAFAKDAYVPAFAREQLPKSGAFYGSAFHRFMQCVDFRAFDGIDARKTEEILRAQIRILSESGRIDAETKDALRIRQLTDFILSGTGKRMIRAACAGTLRREQPFVMQIPGGFAGQDTEDDPEMITQGIIDAFWEEEDGFVLLDYKTDALDDEAELLKRYELQMRLYQEALSRAIDPKPLKETILYSVRMGKAIPFV